MLREVLILNADGIFGMPNGVDCEDSRCDGEETDYASQSAYFAVSTLATAVLLSALDSLDGTFPSYFSTRFLRMIDAYESKDQIEKCFYCNYDYTLFLCLRELDLWKQVDKVNLLNCSWTKARKAVIRLYFCQVEGACPRKNKKCGDPVVNFILSLIQQWWLESLDLSFGLCNPTLCILALWGKQKGQIGGTLAKAEHRIFALSKLFVFSSTCNPLPAALYEFYMYYW
jgi:hypothetical protein